ncbi:MAG: hypothetical protein KDC92_07845 [Bacteroidetes bacterium]|nr:hypothetical protein [Bacteroidota bacterium]
MSRENKRNFRDGFKISKTIQACLLITIPAFFTGCYQCEETYLVKHFSPVYMQRAELENSIKASDAKLIESPGKIYAKDQLFFIVEQQKGIHVIDNSNPQQPAIIQFIEVPGIAEIQMKNNVILANNAVDLVTIDISDLSNPKELGRVVELFPYQQPSSESGRITYGSIDPEQGYVINWEEESREQTKSCYE